MTLGRNPVSGYCGPTFASFDHLVPVSHGGRRAIANFRLAHRRCNSRRNNKPLMQPELR